MNFFNFLNKPFENLHRKFNSNKKDSSIDNFNQDLKKYLDRQDAISKLNELSNDTIFWLDRYEEGYAVCGIKDTCNMFDIPIDLIAGKINEGDFLMLKEDR